MGIYTNQDRDVACLQSAAAKLVAKAALDLEGNEERQDFARRWLLGDGDGVITFSLCSALLARTREELAVSTALESLGPHHWKLH